MLKSMFSAGSTKAWLAALGAALSVLGSEYLNIPEEAGRAFTDELIDLILSGSGVKTIAGFVLTFVLTWFFKNK